MPRDFARYLTATPDDLQAFLASVCAELADLHEEWAMVENARLSAKARGFAESTADTETGRGRYADHIALPNALAVNEVKGRIAALTEERDYLRQLIVGSS